MHPRCLAEWYKSQKFLIIWNLVGGNNISKVKNDELTFTGRAEECGRRGPEKQVEIAFK